MDYNIYRLHLRQKAWAAFLGCVACGGVAWLLYRNIWIAMLTVPAGLLYPKYYARRLCLRRRIKLRSQFKEALVALSSLLSAGRSVENAFASLEHELALLIGDAKSELLGELRVIVNRLAAGEPLEMPLQDFAMRSDLEDIRSFADAVAICKRTGGNLVEVVRHTAYLINEKMDVELELAVLIAQKKFEARVMMAMPFVFVGILGMLATDYMEPLYAGGGFVLMTICLGMLAACCLWMLRVMDIRI